ncbi:hypothetical protein ACS0TY_019588 [Phlomoides rotata]
MNTRKLKALETRFDLIYRAPSPTQTPRRKEDPRPLWLSPDSPHQSATSAPPHLCSLRRRTPVAHGPPSSLDPRRTWPPSQSGTRVQGETEHRRRSKEKQNTVRNDSARRNRNRTSDSEVRRNNFYNLVEVASISRLIDRFIIFDRGMPVLLLEFLPIWSKIDKPDYEFFLSGSPSNSKWFVLNSSQFFGRKVFVTNWNPLEELIENKVRHLWDAKWIQNCITDFPYKLTVEGTRMWRQGANLEGDIDNFIETEQLLEFEGYMSSFLQLLEFEGYMSSFLQARAFGFRNSP